jgi:DNA replication protein DnaC
MLIHQTLDKLEALGLFGMALGLREQLESSQYLSLSFDERLGLLVDREAEARDSRRLALRLKAAKLRQEACVEDIDFRAPRGLDRSVIMSLAQANWVVAHHNLLITGPTGAGKSFIGCALAHAAIRRGHTALYVRTPRLLAELALSRGDGRYVRRLAQLAKLGLLVLDDFLRAPRGAMNPRGLRDPPLAAAAAGRS